MPAKVIGEVVEDCVTPVALAPMEPTRVPLIVAPIVVGAMAGLVVVEFGFSLSETVPVGFTKPARMSDASVVVPPLEMMRLPALVLVMLPLNCSVERTVEFWLSVRVSLLLEIVMLPVNVLLVAPSSWMV